MNEYYELKFIECPSRIGIFYKSMKLNKIFNWGIDRECVVESNGLYNGLFNPLNMIESNGFYHRSKVPVIYDIYKHYEYYTLI